MLALYRFKSNETEEYDVYYFLFINKLSTHQFLLRVRNYVSLMLRYYIKKEKKNPEDTKLWFMKWFN